MSEGFTGLTDTKRNNNRFSLGGTLLSENVGKASKDAPKKPKGKLMGFESKKTNEYPTFIEEGHNIVSQRDIIENQAIDGLSDIPEDEFDKKA